MTDDSPPRPDDPEEPTEEPPVDDAPDAPVAPDDAAAASETNEPAEDGEDSPESDGDDRLRRYVERAILGILFLFAIVVAFRFYFAASNAVSQWVAGPYQSLFQAAFNLVVLLVVGAGIARQLRRMR